MWHLRRAKEAGLDQAQTLRVLTAARDGDFAVRMPLDWTGVPGRIADTVNEIIADNERLAAELARVSRVVGKEGKLSQRMALPAMGGAWYGSIESVNALIEDVVRPTTEMQRVMGAVADGDLSKKFTGEAHGEMLELKDTINGMVDQLNRLVSEVTRVAREVGTEGKLGGQAQSAEVAGVWKDLTDHVNQLAANLTGQVRAIADVATAVTEGDLTRQLGVQASGEVAVLKDKLNEMIRNLRETTRENTEQDWLKTNLERFARMLQGHRDLGAVSSMILSELAPLVSAQHGAFYALTRPERGEEPVLVRQAGYGLEPGNAIPERFGLGEGLVGQCALEKQRILLTDVPADYVRINSGLGASRPLNVMVLPILFEGSVRAVVELASFSRFSATHQAFLDRLTVSIGLVLNTIEANALTETLLAQSQSQAQELRARNQEIERAKRLVEEKAEQLSLSSSYKSEFFANMSHELRTPLNSLLILARELQSGENLTETQLQYATVIHSSGSDLLEMLNDLLDLAKIESGTVVLEIGPVELDEFIEAIERDFRPVADQKGVAFTVERAPGLPELIATDSRRLRQVMKNLLANAFKFTHEGDVRLRVSRERHGRGAVTAFSVTDTGIGITAEMQQRLFEAFEQADGTTARQYGGTGLGLSISQELVRLLGGEITLVSELGRGSTFTVHLPPLPATRSDAPDAEFRESLTPTRRSDDRALTGRKALVIDDDSRNIFALRTLLERSGLLVVSAESGQEGLELLAQTPDIDVVLVDIMMPVMDGYATIRAIRRLQGGEALPIVAVTADVAAGQRRRCMDAGASAYISKPVDSEQLLSLLTDRLGSTRSGAGRGLMARSLALGSRGRNDHSGGS